MEQPVLDAPAVGKGIAHKRDSMKTGRLLAVPLAIAIVTGVQFFVEEEPSFRTQRPAKGVGLDAAEPDGASPRAAERNTTCVPREKPARATTKDSRVSIRTARMPTWNTPPSIDLTPEDGATLRGLSGWAVEVFPSVGSNGPQRLGSGLGGVTRCPIGTLLEPVRGQFPTGCTAPNLPRM